MKSKAGIPGVAIAVSTFFIFAVVSCDSNSFSIEATSADSLWTPQAFTRTGLFSGKKGN